MQNKGGQVKIMTTLIDYESLPKEQKEAIGRYYLKQFEHITKLISGAIAELNLHDDRLGFLFLHNFITALLIRGSQHLWGELDDMPKTIKGWNPRDLN